MAQSDAAGRGKFKGFYPPTTDEDILSECPSCGEDTHPGYKCCLRCSTDVLKIPFHERESDS